MRKYNSRTRRMMVILGIIFVIFIVVFSLFLNRYNKVRTTAYKVATGSVLFDHETNKIVTNEDSTMKIRWAGDYYLDYNEDNINLGKNSVVYNSNNGDIALYGKFYEVNSNGKVNNLKDENVIKSSVRSRFYKLSDRKYLLVDRTIEAVNSSFVTSNYLIVNLDKSGNATLLNNKVSLKTISPTKLRTSSYTFDIANELLNFGGEDIDLKKIIGTTNKYDKDYDINADSKKSDSSSSSSSSSSSTSGFENVGGSGSGGGASFSNDTNADSTNGNGTTKESSSAYTNNYDSGISDETVDEIIKGTRNTSVIRITPNINSISIDYVVYDPENEIKSVYVELENTSNNQKKTIYLNKTDTNVLINDLSPNTYYNLTFKYNYIEGGQTLAYVFDTFGVYTKVPKMILSVPKVLDNKIYYQIDFDNTYNIVGGTLNLLVDGQIVKTTSISAQGTTNKISGSNNFFDIEDLKLRRNTGTVVTLKLVLISFNTYSVNPNITYKFIY